MAILTPSKESGKIVQSNQRPDWDALLTAEGPQPQVGADLGRISRIVVRCLPLLIGTTILSMALAYWWTSSRPPAYEASFDLLVRQSTAEGRLVSAVQPNTSTGNSSETLGGDNTLLTILTSPKLLRPALQTLQAKYPGMDYGALSRGLVLENPSKTNILRVTYKNTDPKQVQQVLQVVSQVFLRYSLESQRTDISQGVRFVEIQLPGLQARVNQLQSQLQKFRQTYNLSDPNTQSEQLSVQISNLYQQQYENQIALQENQASYHDLQNQVQSRNSYQMAAAALVKNSNYQKVRNQLLDLDNQIARQSAIYGSEHPGLIALREQRQQLLPLLDQEMHQVIQEMGSNLRDLSARRQALNQTRKQLLQNMKDLSIRTREFNDLQRELRIATDNLTQFLSKRATLKIESAQQEIPWELTTPPTPPRLVQNETSRTMILGGIMGLCLGLGAAFLLDKIRNVFYTPEEVKADTILPLLGVLPYAHEVRRPLALRPTQKRQSCTTAAYIEAARSLYINIRLLSVDTPIHSLAITSIYAKDGKTTVAIQLARIAATLGQRVLLVDTDLRKPQLHNALGVTNQQGLTDIMASDVTVKDFIQSDIIQSISPDSSLFVLSAGQIPPDPLRILTSEKMKQLSKGLEAAFDLVIYDTPPSLGLADTTMIATQTDGVILVVGLENTERNAFADTLEALSLSSTIVHGVVVNGWKGHSRKYYQRSRGIVSPRQLAHAPG
jgi:capsular exopolysaccharide synthesis family protein